MKGNNSGAAVLLAAVWCGLLTGLLEGAAFSRFPLLRNPDLPWIAVLLDVAVFLFLGCGLLLLSRFLSRRRLMTAAHFVFFLLMFYDCATVGVGNHARRVVMRALALVLAAGMAAVVWKFSIRWESFQRRSLAWLALFALLYTGVPPARRALQEHRQLAQVSPALHSPNVLILIVDTLRADHLSAYGYKRQTSPRISELAKRGVLFQNAIAPSSWTLPSHASLLTAHLPHEHGVDRGGSYLNGHFPTLAEAFRARGYRTAAFSANWWNFARRLGFGRGFIHFQDFDSVASAVAQTNMGQRAQNLLLKLKLLHWPIGRSRADAINHDILHWLDHSRGPFFVVANYMDVHQPYLPPLECLHRFSRLARPRGGMFFANPHPANLTPARVQDEMDAYDASIYCLDRQIASLTGELKKRGLLQNTILVFTSDHGDGFNEHGLMSHGNSLYWELVHVPLIIAGPGIPEGATVEQPASLMWLPATLLTLTGAHSGSFPGTEMQAAWRGGRQQAWPAPVAELRAMHMNPAAANYSSNLESIVAPKWQLILGGKSGSELYRLDSDPREADNLVARDAAVAQVLQTQLRQEEATGDTSPNEVAGMARETPPQGKRAAPPAPAAKREKPEQAKDWERMNDYLKALGYAPR